MSIWILALIVVLASALAGWRQGAIRAAFSTVGVLISALLAVPVGKLVHPLLPHVGATNPLVAWALAPLIGFILVSIAFMFAGQPLHKKVEHFYRYNAGDLRQALWERLNSRLGICLGVLNGVMTFVLVTFVVFHLAYFTKSFISQAPAAPKQPSFIRLANQLGDDLAATKLDRMAIAVGKLPPAFYQLSDLSGFVLQQTDPNFGSRLVAYPAFTSLWQRPDMMPFVQDPLLTNALTAGVTLGDLFDNTAVQALLANKDQTKMLTDVVITNLADLTNYLATGKSAKYGDKIIGRWDFNPAVTIAWLRQSNPKMPASEMRAIRAWMFQAYAPTHILVTGDKQIFVKGLPRLKSNGAGQPPTTENNDWLGDWTPNGNNYDLHLTFSGEDKYMTANAEDLRLTLKDGKSLLIFDRID